MLEGAAPRIKFITFIGMLDSVEIRLWVAFGKLLVAFSNRRQVRFWNFLVTISQFLSEAKFIVSWNGINGWTQSYAPFATPLFVIKRLIMKYLLGYS